MQLILSSTACLSLPTNSKDGTGSWQPMATYRDSDRTEGVEIEHGVQLKVKVGTMAFPFGGVQDRQLLSGKSPSLTPCRSSHFVHAVSTHTHSENCVVVMHQPKLT